MTAGSAGARAEPRAPSAGFATVPGLACPGCGAGLAGLACPTCGTEYPAPGGIPWLFADPDAARAEWRNRYDHARRRLGAELARVQEARRAAAAGPTRRRLDRLAAGQVAYAAEIDAILAPVLGAGGAPLESHLALRTRLPATQGLLTYESNVFRDWCWGAKENAAALDEVRAVLGDRRPARVLVLGSGAGRLAWDLHQVLPAAVTVALDLNPLLAHVGQRVSRGETLELTEFPLAPRRPEDASIARRLTAPGPTRPGLAFVLADALRPPFVPGSFDLVVTPWLLDILEHGARRLLHGVNQLLAPGGCWINHGSVAFTHPDPAEQFTLDELQSVAAGLGFEFASSRERELRYLCCPESRHGRVETVATFLAVRARACPAPPDQPALPDWITAGTTPIPALPAFRTQALATRTHAYVMSLVDGRRSLADIARTLARHELMDEHGARAALAGFFTTMYEEATRGRGL